jgi:membrane protein YqaA with SNARE-associated domain
MAIIGEKYANNAFLSIFAGAFTPISYKAIMITAGIFNISMPVLFVASVLEKGWCFLLFLLL